MPVNTGKEQAGGQFAKGNSGNPAGRPKGSRNKATLAALNLLEGQIEQITQTAINKALEGDMQAIKLVMERVLPPVKELPVEIDIVEARDLSGIQHNMQLIFKASTAGQITTSQAQSLLNMLEHQRQMIETIELEKRIEMLEQQKEVTSKDLLESLAEARRNYNAELA